MELSSQFYVLFNMMAESNAFLFSIHEGDERFHLFFHLFRSHSALRTKSQSFNCYSVLSIVVSTPNKDLGHGAASVYISHIQGLNSIYFGHSLV